MEIAGEVRGMEEAKARDILSAILGVFRETTRAAGAGFEAKTELSYQGFTIEPTASVARLFERAAHRVGLQPVFVSRGGGSDTNC